MLFNSYIFILAFLPCTIIVYYTVNRHMGRSYGNAFLLLMSYIFVGYMDKRYLLALIISTVFNYVFVWILNQRKYKAVLALGIILNILALGVFKYGGLMKGVLIPLGISFYTFKAVSSLIDCYRGDESLRQCRILDYALFLGFFPAFTQGPITYASEILPHLHDTNRDKINYDNMARGFYRFALGLGEKVLIADYLARVADTGYNYMWALDRKSAIMTIVSYSLQIFLDFSAYTDMAIGVALMLNIELPENFDSPYAAKSISEFWKRWHLTLTRFLTKYVYIPLGGNRRGKLFTCINIMIVFIISGLWHGAAGTFLVWGALHALAMIIERLLPRLKLGRLFTYIYVSLCWVFFRAPSLPVAFELINKALGVIRSDYYWNIYESINSTVEFSWLIKMDVFHIRYREPGIFAMILSGAILLVVMFAPSTRTLSERFRPTRGRMIISLGLMLWCILSLSGVSTYSYWNF